MKKKLIFTLILVLALSVGLVGCNFKYSNTLTAEQETFYSTYLSNIEDSTPINRIALLGSHDSGTYDMTSVFKFATITQGLSIGDQLKYGCRYFDIRVNKKNNGTLNIFHDIDNSGVEFSIVVNDILNFIKTNKSEFLVLDFQHFKNDSQKAVIDYLNTSGLTEYAIQNQTQMSDLDFINSLTLQELRGKIVIVWGSNEAYSQDYPYLFRRNNDSCSIQNAVLDSLYYSEENKKSSDKFISEALPVYMNHILSKEKGLTVLQGQLTSPSVSNLKDLEKNHNSNMSNYVRNIPSNASHLAKINIIMRDFIGSDLEKTNSVLYLNIAKGIVKESSLNYFSTMTKKINTPAFDKNDCAIKAHPH